MSERIAFLGTGLIGGGLAVAAAARGDEVVLWNRDAAKAVAIASEIGARATVVDDPREAIRRVGRAHLAFTDDAAVDGVLSRALDGASPVLIVDHSTTSVAGTRARAARLATQGVAFVHAPVFMSPAMCRQAGGLMLLAGDDAPRARALPALEKMTGKLIDCGATREKAALLKLVGNALIFSITAGLADVYALARANGVAAEDVRALFDVFNPTGTLTIRGKKMAAGDFTPSFALTMARKDAGLMLDAAGDEALHLLPAIVRWMDEVIADGDGGLDVGALAKRAVVG